MNYGVNVQAGNFCIRKTRKHLSKKETDVLYAELPEKSILRQMRKDVQRAGLPCIEVSTVSGSWKVVFAVSDTMYSALDSLTVVKEGGVYTVGGPERRNVEYLLTVMYADCSIVGDAEYLRAKYEALDAYIKRLSAKRIEEERGRNDEEVRKESDEAVDDVMERARLTRAAETFMEGGHAE